MKSIFIVVGHEITFPDHRLSKSSSLRCDLLWSQIRSRPCDEYTVVFMGKGRLQGNCEHTISECMYLHYKEKYGKLPSVHIDHMSKDSVGDAVYSREALDQIPDASSIVVITSDWHVKRLSIIFERVYGSLFKKVSIVGAKEIDDLSFESLSSINNSEATSIAAFLSTFPEADGDSDWNILLKLCHPLYSKE